MHECKSMCKRAAARLPVVIPIWFLAIIFPFFGPINSTVGSLLVSFTVYIIPALAHMFTFRSAASREVSFQFPPQHTLYIILRKWTHWVKTKKPKLFWFRTTCFYKSTFFIFLYNNEYIRLMWIHQLFYHWTHLTNTTWVYRTRWSLLQSFLDDGSGHTQSTSL